MKKIAFTIGLVVLTAAATCAFVYEHLTGEMPWSQSYPENEIHTTLHSDVLKEDREIIIHLSQDYDPQKKYPVMYMLDGSSDDPVMARAFAVLSAAGHAPATIVVGIPNLSNESRQRDLTPPYLRMDIDEPESPMGEGDRFLLFMETELIPFMEKNYSVSQERLFSGNSRGGLLVMHSLMHKPDLFQARFCFSTPYWRENEIMVSKIGDFLATQDTLNTFVYMSVGDRETDNMKKGFESMRALFKDKAPAGCTWHATITKKADHQSNAKRSSATGIGLWGKQLSVNR